MSIQQIKKQLAFVFLAAFVLVGVMAHPAAAADEEESGNFHYTYVLLPTESGAADGVAKLELYAAVSRIAGNENPDVPAGPLLDAGAFGLRFPKWVKVEFEAGADVTLQRVVSTDRYSFGPNSQEIIKDNYHAFAWTGAMRAGSSGTISKNWAFNQNVGCYCLKLGTYTLSFSQNSSGGYDLPSRSDVGLLDWLKADEAIAKELNETEANGSDALNATIWNPETGCYQGYYAESGAATAEEALLVQTDIGFRFIRPASWPGGFTMLSYDPKKPTAAKLYASDGKTLVATLAVPVWSEDDGRVFAATAANSGGVGAYFTGIDLDKPTLESGQSIQAGQTYYLVVTKPGHLPQTLKLKATSSVLGEAEGFPASDGWLYLPAGDVNGDGRIDMADRAALLGVLGVSWQTAGTTAYYADIDGDGRVTMADLSILMSPMNYTKKAG